MKIRKTVKTAAKQLGFENPRKFQIEPINSLIDGNDTFVIAPTSAGKSAIYQIAALVGAASGKWTLVIEPLLALMEDQVRKLQQQGIAAAAINSRNQTQHPVIMKNILENQTQIVYVTAERLQSRAFQELAAKCPPWLVVVDEAHCVLDWGYTFRKDYLRIKDFIKTFDYRPVIAAFTATAPKEYRKSICNLLGMKKPKIYTSSLVRNNIILLKKDCSGYSIKKRLACVKQSLKKYGQDGRTIVYCATRKNVDIVANYLSEKFPHKVAKCHAYMTPEQRDKQELQFINGTKSIMVATTAFGMGIDMPDIRLIIHFNLPLSTIDYYQQIGRAGRDGLPSHAILLFHPDDISLNRFILEKSNLSSNAEKWMWDRVKEMEALAESQDCLMQQLLKTLSEEQPAACRHCTNCQKSRRNRHEK